MKKIRFGIGVCLMLSAALISDDIITVAIYLFAAAIHEAGHLLAARAMKINISDIRFDFNGAKICTSGILSYRKELLLSVSGPMANLFSVVFTSLAAKLLGIAPEALLDGAGAMFYGGGASVEGILGFFALSSCLQAATNLMPVSGFDGGRVLYCICAPVSERAAATLLGVTSAMFAFVLWTVALYLMLRISSGLGIYVFSTCIFAASVMRREESG